MRYLFIAIAALLALASIHGIATGSIVARTAGDISRKDQPRLFWFVAIAYLAFALVLARMAYYEPG